MFNKSVALALLVILAGVGFQKESQASLGYNHGLTLKVTTTLADKSSVKAGSNISYSVAVTATTMDWAAGDNLWLVTFTDTATGQTVNPGISVTTAHPLIKKGTTYNARTTFKLPAHLKKGKTYQMRLGYMCLKPGVAFWMSDAPRANIDRTITIK